MGFAKSERRQADLARLTAYVEAQPDGTMAEWLTIEQATGVRLSPRSGPPPSTPGEARQVHAEVDRGRGLLREALRRCGRPYLPRQGEGIEFSSADTAVPIVDGKVRRVVRAARVATTTTDQVIGRHEAQLTASDRDRLIQKRAVLAALDITRSLARPLKA